MLFPEKLRLIRKGDRVLEIGPGSSPYHRSNSFLEFAFETELDRVAQRGGIQKEANFEGRPVYYYNGGRFPFEDNQFDYVICSHVVEHVPNLEEFVQEIFRVGGGRGYLEYPLITYEFMYDFDVHLHFVKYDFSENVLKYMPKDESLFSTFSPVTSIFYRTLELGWDDLFAANHLIFFEGFEFEKKFKVKKCFDVNALIPDKQLVVKKSKLRHFLGKIFKKLKL